MKHYPVKCWKTTTPLTNPHFTSRETEAQKGLGSVNGFAALLGPNFKEGRGKINKLFFLLTCLPHEGRGSGFSPHGERMVRSPWSRGRLENAHPKAPAVARETQPGTWQTKSFCVPFRQIN